MSADTGARSPLLDATGYVEREQQVVERFVRAEYWRLVSEGRIPYALPVCPLAPKRPDHRG